jgi:SAM-dependent methyltransferase
MSKFIKTPVGYFVSEHLDLEVISYPEEGNALCYEMESNSQWFQARNKTIKEVLERHPFHGDFLDVGGGNGYQLKFLQEVLFRPTGRNSAMCEPGADGCLNATLRGVENVYCTTLDKFPFEDFNIGGVGLFDVLEHIEDDEGFLDKIASFLPDGGRIYITVPALMGLWSDEDVASGHFRRYNKRELARVAEASKLKVIDNFYFFSYYTLFLYVLRVLPEKFRKSDAKRTSNFDAEKNYHRMSGYLKFFLNLLHKFESKAIKYGLKAPVGTSMFIVLEK